MSNVATRDRVQPDAASGVREVVIKPINELDGHWILESADARGSGTAAEIAPGRAPRLVVRDGILPSSASGAV